MNNSSTEAEKNSRGCVLGKLLKSLSQKWRGDTNIVFGQKICLNIVRVPRKEVESWGYVDWGDSRYSLMSIQRMFPVRLVDDATGFVCTESFEMAQFEGMRSYFVWIQV